MVPMQSSVNLLGSLCRQLLPRGAGPAGQDADRRRRGGALALSGEPQLLGQLLCKTCWSGCSEPRQRCRSGKDL